MTQTTWEALNRFIAAEGSLRIRRSDIEDHPTAGESLLRVALGDEPLTSEETQSTRKPKKDDQYFFQFLSGFSQVAHSFQNLEDIAIYAASFPYKSKDLDRVRTLRYHVENHFHELFVFREHFELWIKQTIRAFKGDRRHAAIQRELEAARKTVYESLKGVNVLRNKNVHVKRYEDRRIERLNLLSLITLGEDDAPFKRLYDSAFLEERRSWLGTIRKNNVAVSELLDHTAAAIYPVLFSPRTGRMVYPRKQSA